ncbi:HNH endonuclease signature motif containing protein [Halorubrum halodurans]|uniref:HNH nuclease domain-containing protein n=1 Tax=Halorubrum halodurans TaxID=1383851 RepID=A0A256IJD5_9EURY|nr:HNH endonuclease signature motif containing protein [Halorubrum halodurans]OYR56659.1 hypothetical protein DJ70_08055 [Halorubrum halodurans]
MSTTPDQSNDTEPNRNNNPDHDRENNNTLTIPDTGLPNIEQRFNEKIRTGTPPDPDTVEPGTTITTPCHEWTAGTGSHGYGAFRAQGSIRPAHRVAWQLHHATALHDDNKTIHHKCRNKTCVNPDHLELLDRGEHTRRTYENGELTEPSREAAARGGRNGTPPRKIDADTGAEIRSEYQASDVTQQHLADKYNVSTSLISKIINRKRADSDRDS